MNGWLLPPLKRNLLVILVLIVGNVHLVLFQKGGVRSYGKGGAV
jgi:hypothetical protein